MAGKPRDSVKMTAAEIEDYLTSNNKVQVATIGPDGAPHLTTLFYAMVDGRIAFWTYGSSQKIKNLRRDPRISCLIETGVEYSNWRASRCVAAHLWSRITMEYVLWESRCHSGW